VPKLPTRDDDVLQVRIGISTGLVVVGDLIGEGAAQEQAVVGETPNLAARLQALAEPGQVVISQSTRQLTGGLFEYGDLGRVALKGLTEPVRAWRVFGTSEVESRFEAQHGAALTPLVGREEELETLLRRWKRAKAGDGSVVLVSGEPGIGKSRIVQALMEQLGNEHYTRLRQFCSPHHQDTALYPTIAQLERAAGFRRDDTDAQRLDKLQAVLAQGTNELAEAVPLLATLLSIPTGDRYPSLELTPQKRKEKTLKALLAQVEGLSERQPLMMLVEDAHWIDPTSLELLDLTVDRVANLPVLLIITFRPEFTPPWLGRPHVALLSLTRLAPRERAEMIAGVTGGKALPKEITTQIIERTDGVPLFVEELTKAVVESGVLADAGDHYAVTGPMAPPAIPSTLQASLLARLDRLAPVREVAQIAAVIGRQFSHELISMVAPMPRPQLDDALDRLVGAELIYRRGVPPEAEYSFKHALVQEAAYQSLLKSTRQGLHARIGEILERSDPALVEAQPELLAHHFGEAGFPEKAIDYWTTAGERTVRRGANVEAIRHFRRALTLLERLPERPERAAAEIRVLAQLGPALLSVEGYAAPEVERVYARARQLAGKLASSVDLVPPLVGLWLFHFTRAEIAAARETTEELFRVAHRLDDPGLLLQAHHAVWPMATLCGEFPTALVHIGHGLDLYDADRHRHHAFLYLGHDPAVCAHAIAAAAVWMLGDAKRAARHVDAAVQLARRLAHAPTLALALWVLSRFYAIAGDVDATLAMSTELLVLCDEHRLGHFRSAGSMFQGPHRR
jgi:predicted ATPase